jgi:hypothetical protein
VSKAKGTLELGKGLLKGGSSLSTRSKDLTTPVYTLIYPLREGQTYQLSLVWTIFIFYLTFSYAYGVGNIPIKYSQASPSEQAHDMLFFRIGFRNRQASRQEPPS